LRSDLPSSNEINMLFPRSWLLCPRSPPPIGLTPPLRIEPGHEYRRRAGGHSWQRRMGEPGQTHRRVRARHDRRASSLLI
jgi:hypothetical protein